ncbi:MAG: Calx-beta domain-containing protein [Actinomycetota bacterium]
MLAAAAALMATMLPGLASAAPQFGSSGPISIPGKGAATPYPSTINVSRVFGLVTDINVTVDGFSHPRPREADLLLVGPSGANTLIMSDVGGESPVSDLTVIFDDEAAARLSPTAVLTSGRFKPANPATGDVLPPPAPTPNKLATLRRFVHSNPNGQWKLFVHDGGGAAESGTMSGWRLEITAAVPSVGKAKVREGRSVTFSVRLSSAMPAGADPVVLTFRTVKGTAKAGEDFTAKSGTISFPAGKSVIKVSVQTRDDGRREHTERFFLKVTEPTGGTARGRGRIRDND